MQVRDQLPYEASTADGEAPGAVDAKSPSKTSTRDVADEAKRGADGMRRDLEESRRCDLGILLPSWLPCLQSDLLTRWMPQGEGRA